MQSSEEFIKSTRRKFIFFSLIGVLLVLFISLAGLRYHKKIMEQQKSAQELYTKLEKQIVLVNKVSSFSEKFDDYVSKQKKEALKGELLDLISELDKYNQEFNEWLSSNKEFLTTKDLNESIKKSDLKNNIEVYLTRARELVDDNPTTYAQTRENIRFLSQSSRGGLRDIFERLNEKIVVAQTRTLSKLREMGIMLVSLCVLQVVLVWLLVFRPLYSAIVIQHEKVVDALLKANTASRSKTDFLANISHEIRTPMTAIMGYANLLKDEKLPQEKKAESAQIINRNAAHLLELIDEILDISKMESGKFDFEKEKVDVSSTLNEVFSLINVKAQEKEIDLEFGSEGDIPKYIFADRKRVKQILFNIIGNSIKFTDEGFVEVKAKFNKKTNKLMIRVRDTGCGIPTGKISSLFKPFQQADTSVTRVYGGSGLGLVLSRGLARGMGGDISIVESKVDEGTTMDVTIDVGTDEPELIGKLSTNVIQEDYTEIENLNEQQILKNYKVLVVDDAKENARLFKYYLEQAGASVCVANDGFDALEESRREEFDLILLDLQMPGKDGFQVIKELRSEDYRKPIVALTAHAMQEEKLNTKKAGFDGHITKPVKPDILVRSVKYHIDQYSSFFS